MATTDIGIDLGTANTVITLGRKGDRMAQYMIREFILRVTGKRLLKPRIIICVPSFITDVEKRAVVEAAMSAGSRKAYLIDEPIAALIGAGVNIGKARGNMIVDIGGGTTDVAIVSMNGIVTSHSIKVAGNTLDHYPLCADEV